MVKKIYNKFKYFYKKFNLKILNNICNILNNRNYLSNIAIVSSDKFKNKVLDDILLRYFILKYKSNCEIVSWEDNNVNYSKYDLIVIRSIWGYQNSIDKFMKWLDKIERCSCLVVNDISMLKNNFLKNKQIEILDKNKIPHINTSFIFEKKDLKKSLDFILKNKFKNINSFVIKPVISGSGNNTYVLSLNGKNHFKNSIKLNEIESKFDFVFDNKNNGIMIQPFMSEIFDGEYSVIFIKDKLIHCVKRSTNIFTDRYKVEVVKDVDDELIELSNRIININEFKNYIFIRIDLIKTKNEYKVMEIELLDPDLFFSYNKSIRNKGTMYFAKQLVKKTKK